MTPPQLERRIIIHVGTSVLDRVGEQNLPYASWVKEFRDGERTLSEFTSREPLVARQLGEALGTRLRQFWDRDFPDLPDDPAASADNRAKRRRKAPAELASLDLIGLREHEPVLLLGSDNNEGQLAREMLYFLLRKFFGEMAPAIEGQRVSGVDTKQGSDFVAKGLPNYIAAVSAEAQKLAATPAEHRRLVFNITGGYKGLIPFATLTAQLIATRPTSTIMTDVVYAHEHGDVLIKLEPTVPLDWRTLDNLIRRLAAIVDNPGSDTARRLSIDSDLRPFVEPQGEPGVLARTLVLLYRGMQWI